MRVTKINAENFLGIHRVAIDVKTPVVLVAGPNGAGKSSLHDAIRLALCGDLGRVTKKKEAAALIRTGADVANVRVVDADGDEHGLALTRSGKIVGAGQHPDDPVLPLVLDAQRFAEMEPDDRRRLLYDVMRVSFGPDAITERLRKRELHAGKIDTISPLLRGGFDPAMTAAKEHASQARGAWKATTGENWGSEKAKTWRAGVPAVDADLKPRFETELRHVDIAIEKWQEQIAGLRAEQLRRQKLRDQLPELQKRAAKLATVKAKMETDRAEHARVEAELKAAREAAGGGPRIGLEHDGARAVQFCMEDLKRHGCAVPGIAVSFMVSYVAKFGALDAPEGDAAARARIPSLEQALALCARTLANDDRDHGDSAAAHAQCTEIAAELDKEFDAAAFEEAEKQIADLTAQRTETLGRIDAQRALQAEVDAAERRTQQAAEHRLDVECWEAIVSALAPDGIPGELLAEALQPLNARLEQSAADSGWRRVAVGPDMGITYGGRQWRLCSESERWRADAMITEAIAHLSETRLLLLDSADLLDIPSRDELFGWLDTLASMGEIDTAIVNATLKQIPPGLPDTIAGVWLQNGSVVPAAFTPVKAAA